MEELLAIVSELIVYAPGGILTVAFETVPSGPAGLAAVLSITSVALFRLRLPRLDEPVGAVGVVVIVGCG